MKNYTKIQKLLKILQKYKSSIKSQSIIKKKIFTQKCHILCSWNVKKKKKSKVRVRCYYNKALRYNIIPISWLCTEEKLQEFNVDPTIDLRSAGYCHCCITAHLNSHFVGTVHQFSDRSIAFKALFNLRSHSVTDAWSSTVLTRSKFILRSIIYLFFQD